MQVPPSVDREPLSLRKIALWLLMAVAFLLPFEVPLFHLGRLQITTVELALYAALAAWLALVVRSAFGKTSDSPIRVTLRDPVVLAVIAWGLVLGLSVAFTDANHTAAIKFTLRSASGILLFFATRTVAHEVAAGRRVTFALIAGGMLSAVTGLLDWWVPATRPLWKSLGGGDFEASGLARATGVFEYPTVAAMAWEAVVPLVIVGPTLIASTRPHRRRFDIALSTIASALLALAILGSATRTAIVSSLVVLALLLAAGFRWGAWLRVATIASMATIAVSFVALMFWPGSLRGQRLRFWQDDRWFRAEYQVGAPPDRVFADDPFLVPVTLRNQGTLTWMRGGETPVRLSYHWESTDGSKPSQAHFEGVRTELPLDVAPGQVVELMALARAPRVPGSYRLRWDLVQERVTWFSERGNGAPVQVVQVEPSRGSAKPPTASERKPAPELSLQPPSRSVLWKGAIALWRNRPLLGIGPDNFRWQYPTVIAPPQTGKRYTDTRIHANSLYFETLATLGALGVAALSALAAGLIAGARKRRDNVLAIACSVGVASFFVHGVLDYFFEFTPTLCLFWLLAGLSTAPATVPIDSQA